MDFFFNPRSVAVVGASDKGPGSFLLGNLQRGYQGKVFPVNPNYQELGGLPCYPSVDAIPEPVDLALLLIPAKLAPETLTACVKRGVKGAIIQSAGFAEVGEKGRELSHQALEIARQGGLRLWGPNCMGLVDVPNKRFFTLMQPAITNVVNMPGSISLVVQSGMLSAGFLADLMSRHSIGVAKVCSLGNKLDVDECDVLEFLMADPETKVVAMYLESLKRGRRFIELASVSPKPVVVL
ncbi:MAG: CoA-binding protein, partial [Proteobacteria bacterium]|nr:CoA-binding protein [Pseudomonadota bacterium]